MNIPSQNNIIGLTFSHKEKTTCFLHTLLKNIILIEIVTVSHLWVDMWDKCEEKEENRRRGKN